MGWFGKDKKEMEDKNKIPELPKFPSLPKLPPLPKITEFGQKENSMPSLPALPKNDFGEERGERAFDETEFEKTQDTFKLSQKPFKKINEIPTERRIAPPRKIQEIPREETPIRRKEAGPVFIRLDKFEESMRIFNKAKEQIEEVEKILEETKRIKEQEEKELEEWENEINMIKEQLESIDKNVFSKI